jgi:hypothetical protein
MEDHAEREARMQLSARTATDQGLVTDERGDEALWYSELGRAVRRASQRE